MINLEKLQKISKSTSSKIVMLIFDGLGGLPHPDTGKTALETARTPYLDKLAEDSICGLSHPIGPGITPGSGPAHLALFGYNPMKYTIGRGILEALGINYDLKKTDVACRANFCTVDANGLVTDRRAGRIATEESSKLCENLSKIKVNGVKLSVVPVAEHRFVLVFHGGGLSSDLSDTDPQYEGLKPLKAKALSKEADSMAVLVNDFIEKAKGILANCHPANMLILRGFSQIPVIPHFTDIYKLKAAAIASYPMYLGLAKCVGMKAISCNSVKEEFNALTRVYNDYDFFFVHVKKTDTHGEDGNFKAKVEEIEKADSFVPKLTKLGPNVIVVTGDHSTPALLKGHSWHPTPLLIYSQYCRKDNVRLFRETDCASGALGNLPAVNIMPLAMANALKLNKYGA